MLREARRCSSADFGKTRTEGPASRRSTRWWVPHFSRPLREVGCRSLQLAFGSHLSVSSRQLNFPQQEGSDAIPDIQLQDSHQHSTAVAGTVPHRKLFDLRLLAR